MKRNSLFRMVLALCISVTGFAQPNYYLKSIRFKPSLDTATFLPAPNGTMLYGNSSNLWFKDVSGYWKSIGFGTGISGTVAANQLVEGTGTGLRGAGLYNYNGGNLTMGTTSISGDRSIIVESSSVAGDLILTPQPADAATGKIVSRGAANLRYGISTTTDDTGRYWNVKIIDIGDWNMVSTGFVNVAHGLTLSKIVSLKVIIIADGGGAIYNIESGDGSPTTLQGGAGADVTNVFIARPATSQFNSASFDATSFNRGYIVITYIN